MQGITAAIIVFERPRTASLSMLLLFTGLLFAQSVLLSHSQASLAARDIPLVLAPVAALLGILVILNMPLRDPTLSTNGISPVFVAPTVELRTPEDNLTPWQYMTVTWMGPLIKKGITKEMEDKDVWDLGYEYKHARLHDAFRKLHGSVTRRIFVANGMDLVRTTSLSIVQLTASKFRDWSSHHICISDLSSPSVPCSAATAPSCNERYRLSTKRHHHLCCY